MAIKDGSKVKIEYTGTLDNGEVFDSSEKAGKPLEFEIGSKKVIPGFEKAIVDMKKGEEKDIKLKSSEAYGDINPELVKEIPRDKLPKEPEPKEGMFLAIALQNGMQIPAKIVKVEKEKIKIDMNHPLAGKNLNFKIKLVEVQE